MSDAGFSTAEDLLEMFSDRKLDEDEKYFINQASIRLGLEVIVPVSEFIRDEQITNDLDYYEGYADGVNLDVTYQEAGQKIPTLLGLVRSDAERLRYLGDDEQGCVYCGGLGHRIGNCPKLEVTQAKQTQTTNNKDFLAKGGADW